MTINAADMPWLKEEIKKFRQSLMKKAIDQANPADRLYAIGIQLFPVDHA